VYAVATLPDFRRRGIAGALLDYAGTALRARGAEALLLAPASEALGDYYAKFGYRPCFYHREIHLDATAYDDPTRRIDATPLRAADFLRLRAAAYAPGGYFVQWDEAALQYALEECALCRGMAWHLRSDTEEGFFVAAPRYGAVAVSESMLTEQLLPYALQLIKRYFTHTNRIYFYQSQRAPAGDWTTGRGDAEPFAMLKCLTPAAQPAASAMPYFGLALD
jgi:hypothetical protein